MYSCIAGFVDAGESLEECVRREAAEEVGIEVDKVTMVPVLKISYEPAVP
jgi:NAD+ diphosphatase